MAAPTNVAKILNPHAAALIFNFRDRLGSEITPAQAVDRLDRTIISSLSIVSMRTTKTKGEPAGTFEIVLAPLKNWVSTLTSGSWIVIMMGRRPIQQSDFSSASADLVKMVGRIDSVRANVTANQQTGAMQTSYIVTGQDWGQVFNNMLYVDPLVDDPTQGAIGSATKLNLNSVVVDEDNNATIKSSSRLVRTLVDFWGKPLKNFDQAAQEANIVVSNETTFTLPAALVNFLNLQIGTPNDSQRLTDILDINSGVPDGTKNDNYKAVNDSAGFLNPADLYGVNAIWQILMAHCNPTLNELYCDLRFERDGSPSLSLYHRIRPFVIRDFSDITDEIRQSGESQSEDVFQQIQALLSPFKNIKRTVIPVEEIISIDAGTNWRDKYNFVEIRPAFSDAANISTYLKNKAQVTDRLAFAREGFRPMIATTRQFPLDKDGQLSIKQAGNWKYLLREWHFDTHRLLNGSISFMGQPKHIEVGSNLMLDASILGPSFNQTQQELQNASGKLLVHVESVSHQFSVSQDGARSFTTTVQFVRGIVADQNGNPLGQYAGRLDSDATIITRPQEDNREVIATSSTNDPDTNNLRPIKR